MFYRFYNLFVMTRPSRKRGKSPATPPRPSKRSKKSSPVASHSREKTPPRDRSINKCNRSPCKHRELTRRKQSHRSLASQADRNKKLPMSRDVQGEHVSTATMQAPPKVQSQIIVLRDPKSNIVQRSKSPVRAPQKVDTNKSGPSRQIAKYKQNGNQSDKIKTKTRNSTQVVKLEGVSNKMLLSRLVHEFMVEFTSIIGVHRVADYVAGIKDNVVFLYLTNPKEYKELLERRKIMIDGNVITMTNPQFIAGRANYTIPFGPASDYDMRMTPPSMGLFGCRQLPVTTTFYVVAVLRQLEHQYPVTGFKLAFCERRQLTRNFGFATFLTRKGAFSLYGKRLNIMGDDIEIKLPDAMPLLISKEYEELIINNRCEFSEEIRKMNWLNVNFTDTSLPMRPLSKGEIFSPPPITQPPVKEPVHPIETRPETSNEVIRHNSPPASPEMSIGNDYEIDEDGVLVIPSTFWLNADAD
jgi:hypothetical protein